MMLETQLLRSRWILADADGKRLRVSVGQDESEGDKLKKTLQNR